MNLFKKAARRLSWALTSRKQKEKLLAAATFLLNLDPDAAALVKAAEKDGIAVTFDPALIGTQTNAYYSCADAVISVNPRLGVGEIALALAHELRHYWQFKTVGLTPDNDVHTLRQPRLSFLFNRVTEADAFAFEGKVARAISAAMPVLLEAEKRLRAEGREGTAEDRARVHAEITQKLQALQPQEPAKLRDAFVKLLDDPEIAEAYDPKEARQLHAWHTSRQADPARDFKAVAGVPPLTLGDVRRILKAGVANDAPGYLDDLSDRQFEALVLRHAHKGARGAVRLMDKFNAAVAANDNEKAETLRHRVRDRVHKL